MIAPGQRVGHYLIETRLGAGGMGEVFRAFDESLERPVAIKVLPRAVEGHPEARARMLREARAASALVHPSIVTVHEVDEYDGQDILVMELVEGETFTHLLQRRGKLPPAEAIGLVRHAGAALEFAHKAGFVHRDIKCSNLMVTPDGRVKVLDFGLSKRMRANGGDDDAPPVPRPPDTVAMRKGGGAPTAPDGPVAPGPGVDQATIPGKGAGPVGKPPSMPTHDSDARARLAAAVHRDDLTVEGAAMGTPGYSALELMDGLAADARADVFSLGVVLYELVTAARPYSGVDWAGVRAQILAENYQRARERVPSLSSELDGVIVRALRAQRDDRTPSVAAMLAQLSDASATRSRRRKLAAVIGLVAASGGGTWAAMRVRGHSSGNRTADAVVAPLPPADAADLTDAAPVLPPPPAAAVITRTGGCVYAPVFLDEGTVAFDLTTPSDARDIATLALPAAGAAPGLPRRIERPGTLEARPARGLEAGELLYVRYDPKNPAGSFVAASNASGGGEHEVIAGPQAVVAALDGAYYYVPSAGTPLRRVRDKIDEAVSDLPALGTVVALVPSRDGKHLFLSGRLDGEGRICNYDLAATSMVCSDALDLLAARPDTGSTGTLYYATATGIRARTTTDDVLMAAAGAMATGGLAVSPSGTTLVWSDCRPQHALRDATVKPAAELAIAGTLADPVTGPGGRVAWVQRGGELVVRSQNATTLVLTAADAGAVMTPAFDAEGGRLTFRRGGAEPGIWVVDAGDAGGARRITQDPSDQHPQFLADGSLVFTRIVDGQAYVYRARDGAPAEPATTEAGRVTVAIDRGHDLVLLRSADDRYYFWWNPETGIETPGPATFAPASDVTRALSLSADGDWMLYQAGAEGQDLWRMGPNAQERVVLPAGTTVSAAAINDDGHVLVVTTAQRGELWRLDAPAGKPW